MQFLDIEVSWEKGKSVTTICRKPTFSVAYTHFESFLSTPHKLGMIYSIMVFIVASNILLIGQIFTKNLALVPIVI